MTAVSCIIPAYNEERTVAGVIAAARRSAGVAEVIVVSDGSTDATAEAAAAAGADLVIRLPKNLGKGGAVMAAARRARGEVLLLLDADLEGLKPGEIRELVRPVQDGGCDMAVGVLSDDLLQAVLPYLSGIRAIRRRRLLVRPGLAATRFGFERALTELSWEERWKVARVPLTGVFHPRKQEKYGLIRGWQGKVRMTVEVLALRGRRPKDPAPRARALAVTTIIAAMVVYVSMGLFSVTRAVGSALGVFPEPTGADRFLIVAAHADDELIATGGLVQRALSAGAEVRVVLATNGDGNRLAAAIAGKKLLPGAADFVAEGEARQEEALSALGRLGVAPESITFLGYPDRGLMTMAIEKWERDAPYLSPFTKASASPYKRSYRAGAPYTGADITSDLEAVIADARPTVILTHHEADRHRDHRALNLFVRRAIRSATARGALSEPRFYTFLIHAWDFPRPLRHAPDTPLLPPKSLRDSWRWLRFDLQPDELALKQAAMQEYRSQLDSPYLRLLLASFLRENELFTAAEP